MKQDILKQESLKFFSVHCSMVLIKRGAIVEAEKSFPSQIRVMNFSEGSPYETLHAYVSNAVSPFFKSYIKETGKAERLIFVPLFFLRGGGVVLILLFFIMSMDLYKFVLFLQRWRQDGTNSGEKDIGAGNGAVAFTAEH